MRYSLQCGRLLAAAALTLMLCACNGTGGLNNGLVGTAPGIPSVPAHHFSSSAKIQHVVVIIQENRSFNDLLYGFPGATTAKYGYDSSGDKIELQSIGLATTWDLEHDSWGFFTACNGTGSIPGTDCQMNGFNLEWKGCGQSGGPACPHPDPEYSYVPHSETKPYFDMGEQYVVADQMYASNLDASSFISHQYFIAAQAEASVDFPYGAWGCPGGSGDTIPTIGPQRQIPQGYQQPCYTDGTLGQEADNAGVSWAYYAVDYSGTKSPGIWSAYQANRYVYYGSDWSKDVISPPSQFLTNVANGKLRQISWVTPTWTNSDHAGSGSKTGPSWVTSVVNAIGESQYWNTTAIFIVWDDYGGWFDPEPPAYKDYDGLGMRIPMIIVSPYAKQGLVSHVHYEHGSILRFIEDHFGLARLSASDKRATSPGPDCFDFDQSPRPFKKIAAPYSEEYFLHQRPDHHLPDDN